MLFQYNLVVQVDTNILGEIDNMSNYRQTKELVDLWNAGKLDHLNKSSGDKLAAMAYEKGFDFEVEERPWAHLGYNLADTATFGLLPDKYFKPEESIGSSIYGQGSTESAAGNLGSLLGLAAGGGALLKGAAGVGRGLGSIYKGFKGGSGASGTVSNVSRGTNIKPKYLPSTNKPYQLGQGDRLGLPGPGVGRQGQLNQSPNILQLTQGPRMGGSSYTLPSLRGPNPLPSTPLQLTQGGKMPGPGMGRMIDNMGRNYPSNVLPRYM